MTDDQTRLEMVERLQNILVARATGALGLDNEYIQLRRTLIGDPAIKDRLPRFIRTCSYIPQFWAFIKKIGGYAPRRQYLWDEFRPLIQGLEGKRKTPAEEAVAESLAKLDAAHVQEAWRKALERREDDPDGAITSARALIETVCKCILDDHSIAYADNEDLP